VLAVTLLYLFIILTISGWYFHLDLEKQCTTVQKKSTISKLMENVKIS
jgi:hypothetical protein